MGRKKKKKRKKIISLSQVFDSVNWSVGIKPCASNFLKIFYNTKHKLKLNQTRAVKNICVQFYLVKEI